MDSAAVWESVKRVVVDNVNDRVITFAADFVHNRLNISRGVSHSFGPNFLRFSNFYFYFLFTMIIQRKFFSLI